MLNNDLGSKYFLQLVFPAFLSANLKLLLLFDPLVKQVSSKYPLYLLCCNPFPEFIQQSWVYFFAELSVKEDSWLLWNGFRLNLHHYLIYCFSVSVVFRLIPMQHISAQSITAGSSFPASLLSMLRVYHDWLLFAKSWLKGGVHQGWFLTLIKNR